jgi:hypothetical protein
MQRAAVVNHLVVALDNHTVAQVNRFGSRAVKISVQGTEAQKSLATGSSHSVSGRLLSHVVFEVKCLHNVLRARGVRLSMDWSIDIDSLHLSEVHRDSNIDFRIVQPSLLSCSLPCALCQPS